MAAKIKITIDGSLVTSEVSGVEGEGCDQVDKIIQNMGKVKSNKKTAAYYKKGGVKAHEQLRE
jgi:hypothetical protein